MRLGRCTAKVRSRARVLDDDPEEKRSQPGPLLPPGDTDSAEDQDAAMALGTRWMLRSVRPIAATKSSMSESVAISGIPPIPRGAT